MTPKPRLDRGPLGLPVVVSPEDPQGYGDRAMAGVAFAPSGQAASVPHESAHAELQALESLVPGATFLEGLTGRASDYAYGAGSQYRNPFERYAYGYQEGVTGQPDTEFQRSASPESVARMPAGRGSMMFRNILDALGGAAERAGRGLGARRRKP